MDGFSAFSMRYIPPDLQKPKFEPEMLHPIFTSMREQEELEDLQADFLKTTQRIGMQLVEAQEAYLQDCAKKLGISLEELAKNYKLESRMTDPITDAPRPAYSNEYKLVYEFRLVPRRS